MDRFREIFKSCIEWHVLSHTQKIFMSSWKLRVPERERERWRNKHGMHFYEWLFNFHMFIGMYKHSIWDVSTMLSINAKSRFSRLISVVVAEVFDHLRAIRVLLLQSERPYLKVDNFEIKLWSANNMPIFSPSPRVRALWFSQTHKIEIIRW